MAKKDQDTDRISKLVAQLIDSTSRVPDTVELTSSILEAFGGGQALAKEIYNTYVEAKRSPMIRGRILNDVMLLIRHASEKTAAAQAASLKNIGKDDLFALAKKILEKQGASEETVQPKTQGEA